ncbi:MAG: ACT domain-containing protein [Pseudomonadota bacterium]|nr:glycine cleavage system protein R [Pseudomonadales bacterium]MDY6920061.1 ACT domain-containing protein [Pseudomonadota bacterium]
MQEYLVISAIGEDKPGIINGLSQAATECDCNIMDTRMTVLGGEFALIMLLAAASDNLARAETALPQVAEQFGLTTILKRTAPRQLDSTSRPYSVSVIALDHPGIVREIASFFSQRQINIEEMETGTYAAAHTGSPMFSLELSVQVPASQAIAPLKEAFIGFCDERNLDATIEPRR